jgi:hypothetical protein
MKNSSFAAVLFSLLALVSVAGWQFYSLTWGDSLSGRYAAKAPDKGLQSDSTGRLTLTALGR